MLSNEKLHEYAEVSMGLEQPDCSDSGGWYAWAKSTIDALLAEVHRLKPDAAVGAAARGLGAPHIHYGEVTVHGINDDKEWQVLYELQNGDVKTTKAHPTPEAALAATGLMEPAKD